MIGSHIRERFFQRYGLELTVEILRELKALAFKSTVRGPDNGNCGREVVTVHWRGADIRMVWIQKTSVIITFLPPSRMHRIAWCLPKRKPHVHGTTRAGRSRR